MKPDDFTPADDLEPGDKLRPLDPVRLVASRRYFSLTCHYDLLFARGMYGRAWDVLVQMLECARMLGMTDNEIAALARRDGLGERLGHLPPLKRKGREPVTTNERSR